MDFARGSIEPLFQSKTLVTVSLFHFSDHSWCLALFATISCQSPKKIRISVCGARSRSCPPWRAFNSVTEISVGDSSTVIFLLISADFSQPSTNTTPFVYNLYIVESSSRNTKRVYNLSQKA